MTDRELLELAARAYGLKAKWFKVQQWKRKNGALWANGEKDVFGTHHTKPWNPLESDSDAFRIGVKLGLFDSPDYRHYLAMERFSGQEHDDMRAHRRAITRAAAAIQLAKETK